MYAVKTPTTNSLIKHIIPFIASIIIPQFNKEKQKNQLNTNTTHMAMLLMMLMTTMMGGRAIGDVKMKS